MLFTRHIWQGREQTTYQYCFDGSSHFDVEQMQPTPWRHLGNRKDVREAMISEGSVSPDEADASLADGLSMSSSPSQAETRLNPADFWKRMKERSTLL